MKEVFEGRATGRLDVMGGIADYSGSLLLQMPIKEQTSVRLSFNNSAVIQIESRHCADQVIILAKDLMAQDFICKKTNYPKWSLYILGCIREYFSRSSVDQKGFDLTIESQVPIGKGVSSSASLELASLRALEQAFSGNLTPMQLARIGQHVEHNYVGAPCGFMDQLAVSFGKPGHLLPIKCQPAQVFSPIEIPEEFIFIGLDSGVTHEINGTAYSEARCAAFMGYTIIVRHTGVDALELLDLQKKKLLPFQGYLANISVDLFEKEFLSGLPSQIQGQDFIDLYRTIIDPVISIDPKIYYQIKSCTAHPVYEHHRIQNFLDLIQLDPDSYDHKLLGPYMFAAHQSYTECGLGHMRTDELVLALKDHTGIVGARVTGGGCGGTVCVLCDSEKGVEKAKNIYKTYAEKYDIEPSIIQ